MLYSEIFAVYPKDYTKYRNTLCAHHQILLSYQVQKN